MPTGPPEQRSMPVRRRTASLVTWRRAGPGVRSTASRTRIPTGAVPAWGQLTPAMSGTRPRETRPPETRRRETRPRETRPPETRPPETRRRETRPRETRPRETRPRAQRLERPRPALPRPPTVRLTPALTPTPTPTLRLTLRLTLTLTLTPALTLTLTPALTPAPAPPRHRTPTTDPRARAIRSGSSGTRASPCGWCTLSTRRSSDP